MKFAQACQILKAARKTATSYSWAAAGQGKEIRPKFKISVKFQSHQIFLKIKFGRSLNFTNVCQIFKTTEILFSQKFSKGKTILQNLTNILKFLEK